MPNRRLQRQFALQRPVAVIANPDAEVIESTRMDRHPQEGSHRLGYAARDRARWHAMEVAAGASRGRICVEISVDPGDAEARKWAAPIGQELMKLRGRIVREELRVPSRSGPGSRRGK